MPLPDLNGKASLNVADFRKGAQAMLTDLRAIHDLSRKIGTIKITADLSAGKSLERAAAQARAAIDSIVPTDMQRRIDGMFGGFNTGLSGAKASAAAFEAEAATVRAQINQLSNAVTIARNQFQQGFGEATPEEVAQLTQQMNRLTKELDDVGVTAKRVFGEYSNEMVKVERANRLAQTTAAAARGEITRLGLASQVKLGVGSALQEYGAQAGFAANGLLQVARYTDQARISQKLFEVQLKNNGVSLQQGQVAAANLADTLKLTSAESEGFIGRLVRQGLSAEKAAEALVRAGASAKLAGRSTADGAENFVSAVEAGDSAMLASIGISENLSTFYAQEAKRLGKRADDLTKSEKAQAAYNLAIAAASDELSLYKQSQDGLTGSSANLELAQKQAGQAIGTVLLPAVTNGTDLILKFTEAYNALPPVVQTGTGILLASTVALGLLATPITSLITLWRTLTASMASRAAAQGVEAVASSTSLLNRVQIVQKFLLTDVSVLYAKANAQAMLYSGSLAGNSAAMNVFSASATRATGALTAFTAAISIYTVAATAALALGLYWAKQVKEITATYEQADKASQDSFNSMQERINSLLKTGSELDRAKAKYLNIFRALQQAQEAPIKGMNLLTGERIYGQVDEARVKKLQADLVAARQNVTQLFTEAQRRGQINLKLTEDQTKAVKALRDELSGRAFDLKIEGLSDAEADLARLGREFVKLREEFKKPFTVKGALVDPAQTPALREGLAQLDAQLAAEQASIREKYAKQATEAARKAALDTQAVEIAAMKEGAAKRTAQRDAEVKEIQANAKKQADQYRDFPAQRAAIEEEARRTISAKRRQWANEDEELARELAGRIADGWLKAQTAQQEAEQAGRDARLAAFNLTLSRQLAAAQGNAQEVARLELAGQRERARLTEENARLAYTNERRALRDNLDRALSDTKLSAQERRAIWTTYYADLNRLGLRYEADERERRQRNEAEEREARAKLALAPARAAVQSADTRVKETQWMRDLATGTQAQLAADRAILSAHQQRAVALQQVLQTTQRLNRPQEEVKQAADAVADAQQQIRVDLKNQLDLTRQLARESYQRRQAEAKFAEDSALTDAQVLDARLRQLKDAQARQRELSDQLTRMPEGTAKDGVLGEWRQAAQEILDLQGKINAMPAEAEQRRVTLLQAQRALLLEQQGLAGSGVAQARANLQAAQEEYALSRMRLATARTEAAQDAARTDVTQKHTAALAAQREFIKALYEQEGQVLDLTEARARAQLELRDLADDALTNAELDLKITRDRLALVGTQLTRGGLNQQDTLNLQRQQIDLIGKQAQQERALVQAQRDRADLIQAITRSQRDLNQESAGGSGALRGLQSALNGIADARSATARAERDYQLAAASGKPEAIRAATDALTGAIKGQRDALRALADQYRQQITSMEGVQEAAARLKQVAYGDQGQEFQAKREEDRLKAIQARRDAAQRALTLALQGGQADLIGKAADDLAKQEERYQKQADLIEKNGQQVTRSGEDTTRRLADQVDALGIQYDRETVTVQERARIADLEAQTAIQYSAVAADLKETVQTLTALPPLRLDATTLTAQLDPISLEALRGFTYDPSLLTNLNAQMRQARMGDIPTVREMFARSAGAGGITVNFYYNGQKMPAPQDIQQLARDLTPLIRAEAQRRNPGGPCGGTR